MIAVQPTMHIEAAGGDAVAIVNICAFVKGTQPRHSFSREQFNEMQNVANQILAQAGQFQENQRP